MSNFSNIEKYRLIKEANKLLDRIEVNVRFIVQHAKDKNEKKAA